MNNKTKRVWAEPKSRSERIKRTRKIANILIQFSENELKQYIKDSNIPQLTITRIMNLSTKGTSDETLEILEPLMVKYI